MNSTIIRNKKITRDFNLSVIGSGYVGLPTAVLFASVGFNVTAIDINSVIVDHLNSGRTPIKEPGLQKLLSSTIEAGNFKASLASDSILKNEDAIIITVQTPIDQKNEPDLTFLMNALENVGKHLRRGMILVICSTIPPGTMLKVVSPFLESSTGLKADIDFFLGYVPERISPGKAIEELIENTRLVGGVGHDSTKIISELFRFVCKNIIETDVITAELAKTAENAFRDVNIAFANQLALISEQNGADVNKVIEVANSHPRVNIHKSGPGVGGPCLTKDPYFLRLNSKLAEKDVIYSSRLLNDFMPIHVVNLTLDALSKSEKKVSECKIAILGTAYKGNVDDSRCSPSEIIIKRLRRLGLQTIVYDPKCENSFGAKKVENIDDCITSADCVILVTDHDEFKEKNFINKIKSLNSKIIIIDTRGMINPSLAKTYGLIYRGIGYGCES